MIDTSDIPEQGEEFFRRARLRDDKHLAFIRTLPCCACLNDGPSEAAHIRSGCLAIDKRETGMGEKPDDKWTLPLCWQCHREQHSMNERDFWEEQKVNPFTLAQQLYTVSGDKEAATSLIVRTNLSL